MAIEWTETVGRVLVVHDAESHLSIRDATPEDLAAAGYVPASELREATAAADRACNERDAALAEVERMHHDAHSFVASREQAEREQERERCAKIALDIGGVGSIVAMRIREGT